MDGRPGMIGNFRYRKPLLLLVLVGGFSYLSWLILTGANVHSAAGSRLAPLDLEPEKCPLDIKEAPSSSVAFVPSPPAEIVKLDAADLLKELDRQSQQLDKIEQEQYEEEIDVTREEEGGPEEEIEKLLQVMKKANDVDKNYAIEEKAPFPEKADLKSNIRNGRSNTRPPMQEWNDNEEMIPEPNFDDQEESTPPLPKPKRKHTISSAEISDRTLSQTTYQPGLDLVRNMMKHAWSGYKKFAWGTDELRPVSQKGKNTLGRESMVLTPVDALDTLFLMGLGNEFEEAREIVLNEMNLDGQTVKMSLFETNIRVLGGLLSAYALTKDERFKEKAVDVGERFLPSFKGRLVPKNEFSMTSVHKFDREELRNTATPPSSAISYAPVVSLAQVGTFSLEFGYLSDITGDPVFRNKALAIIEEIAAMRSSIPGLYPTQIAIGEESQFMGKYSVGAEADSFYEYLLKYWLYTGKQDKLHYQMYKDAVKGIVEHLVATDKKGNRYIVMKHEEDQIMQMEHLACFAPGMLALGAVNEGNDELLALAGDLTESCYRMYHEQVHGIGCEVVSVPSMKPPRRGDHYILRPEVIESIFILWRTTKNPRYRRWALEIAQSIEASCKVPAGGYSGLKHVNMEPPMMNDVQESFFLAETLKYLYLIFASDDLVPLDRWVFNTEAHPLPIQQKK